MYAHIFSIIYVLRSNSYSNKLMDECLSVNHQYICCFKKQKIIFFEDGMINFLN